MKQVTQNYKSGEVRLDEVDVPAVRDGGVLVRSWYSAVSPGTEGMKVREGRLSLAAKARARPDQVKKVLSTLRQQGLVATYQKVMGKLDCLTPLGYSLSGEVVAVGRNTTGLRVGDRVACAGAGYANHAEYNFVPANLVVPVPTSVDMKHAAFATLGAISLHGFRQSEMQLGETACVIGLGLLGQMLVQILRAAGMNVVGLDLVEARCRLAEEFGALAVAPDAPGLADSVKRLTRGNGVDCVFICVSGSSNRPVELAAWLARDRARIVDIGKTRLDLPWNEYYLKELDVRFARSYGPGRYDPTYEERGIDYPIGYVRWTERRNIEAFLDLLARDAVRLKQLVSSAVPFTRAEEVYQRLAAGQDQSIGLVFDFGITPGTTPSIPVKSLKIRKATNKRVAVGLIGAGAYASSMLLPHLRRNREVDLTVVATRSSLSAQTAKHRFGFRYATTDCSDILKNADIDAVIIATRHASHARLVVEALKHGKAVYVEKPLALTMEELVGIRRAVVDAGNSRLMVGFNRRFSPMVGSLVERLRAKTGPWVMSYRVSAGQLEPGSWYADRSEGLRFTGEAGHFIDLLSCVADSRPVAVFASGLRPDRMHGDDLDNLIAVLEYENGSIANLTYTTQGGTKLPKEYLEVIGSGTAVQLQNFERTMIFEGDDSKTIRATRIDKGQSQLLGAFIDAVANGAAMPIGIDSLVDTTAATLAVLQSWQTGERVRIKVDDTSNSTSSQANINETRSSDNVPRGTFTHMAS